MGVVDGLPNIRAAMRRVRGACSGSGQGGACELGLHAAQEPGTKAPVIVAGKDQGEVDNDYLLIPVNILDHEGALGASFPVENRLLPQGARPVASAAKRFGAWGAICCRAVHACVHAHSLCMNDTVLVY